MNLLPGTARVTADSAVGTSGKRIRLYNVNLMSSTTTGATLILKNGTSTSGTAYAQVDGIANQCVVGNWAAGMCFPNGLYADCDTNISYATFTFTEEA